MASNHNRTPVPATGQKQKMSKKKKLITVILVVALSVVFLGGVIAWVVTSNWEEYKQLAADREVVAVCNGYEIPYEELRFVTMFYKDMLADSYGEDIWDTPESAEKYREELEKLVKENINVNYVILSTAAHLGIDIDSPEIDRYVDDQMEDLRSNFQTAKEFDEWKEEQWMTDHYLEFSIAVSYLESVIYYTLLDNDMYRFSQANIEEFKDYVENSGEFVRTVHVYIENKEGEDPIKNLAVAQGISDELQAISDPHDRLDALDEYIGSAVNDDLMSLTGNGYYFTRGEMEEAYEEAAFGIGIGEVSEPVTCSGGTFVIMRLAPQAEYISNNVQTLLNNYHSVALGLYEDQFRDSCTVTFTEYGKTIDLVLMK